MQHGDDAASVADTLVVERATRADCPAIASVHVASWRAAYGQIIAADYLAALNVEHRRVLWEKQLDDGQADVLVARNGATVVGFIATGRCRDPDAPPTRGELWALYVLPSHWDRGVGRALWLAARVLLGRRYDEASLWVLALNARGIRFYGAAGFQPRADSDKAVLVGNQTLVEVQLIQVLSRSGGNPH